MKIRSDRLVLGVAVAVVAAALAWVLFVGLPRWTRPQAGPVAPAAAAPESTPKIRARIYYMAEDGLRLEALDREVEVGEGTADQAQRLVVAQLEAPPPPLLPVFPTGTVVRGVYVSPEGVAYVDLSGQAARAHGGGSLDEIFTVYSLVNTLTDNLPAITAVQILLDGKEADTLAGHVDLRRPLTRNLRWAEPPGAASQAQSGAGGDAAAPRP